MTVPTLNLRPGMDSVAYFTYIINFSDFKLISFMGYTYNMTQLPVKIQNGSLIFRAFSSLILHATLNLRTGMDSAAFFTYIINFSDFKLTSFMAYTNTELDLDWLVICLAIHLVIHALFIIYPQIVYIGHFKLSNITLFVKIS